MAVLKKIIETQEFATLPTVAAKVLSLLEDENVDLRNLARVIEADPSLTLKLLRVANSPLYATRTEVNSIHQAIMKLGLSRLTNIVLGVSIFSKFLLSAHNDALSLMEKFWWHASCTGMIAKSLSVKLDKFFKENEFIGGLLHDIGKLAMIQYNSNDYKRVVDLVEADSTDLEAEMQIFGTTHVEVGAEIAKLWKLPPELTTIITYHHNPSAAPQFKELVAAVRIPDMLSEVWGAGFYEGIRSLNIETSEPWQVLAEAYPELSELDLEIFTFELENDFKKSSEFLTIIRD